MGGFPHAAGAGKEIGIAVHHHRRGVQHHAVMAEQLPIEFKAAAQVVIAFSRSHFPDIRAYFRGVQRDVHRNIRLVGLAAPGKVAQLRHIHAQVRNFTNQGLSLSFVGEQEPPLGGSCFASRDGWL